MSISDEDTDAGSDFIELQPISEYEENIELGIDPICLKQLLVQF
jgi:hypothetical protein